MQMTEEIQAVQIVMILCSIVLVYLNEHICCYYMQEYTRKGRLLFLILGTGIRCGVWFAAWFWDLPMILLYGLILISFILMAAIWTRGKLEAAVFWSSLFFVFHVFWHMAALSVISLVTSNSLADTYHLHYIGLMFATELFPGIMLLVFRKTGDAKQMAHVERDAGQFRQFLFFMIFAVGYYLFDAVIIRYDLTYWQLSVFLLGSCFLINLQVILFANNTNQLIQIEHYEEDYFRLEEERSAQIRQEMELQNLAYKDSLTGAYNRRYSGEIIKSIQTDHEQMTIAYIDLNRLKTVNDRYGHSQGDFYIRTAASCINRVLRKTDVLARIGGDEFLVISRELDEKTLSDYLAQANEALKAECREFPASFSFGVMETRGGDVKIEEILRESDRRMYRNKASSRPEQEEETEKQQLENRGRRS